MQVAQGCPLRSEFRACTEGCRRGMAGVGVRRNLARPAHLAARPVCTGHTFSTRGALEPVSSTSTG